MATSESIKAGQAYVELTTKDDKLVGGLRKGEQELGRFSKAMQATTNTWYERLTYGVRGLRKEQRTSGESALQSVLSGGSGEIANTLLDYLGAGAAGIGIDFAARGLKTMADEANKLKQELREGSVGAGDVAERMLAAVPIFGQVWQAGRAIREVFTGEQAAIEAINREARLTTAYFDAQAKQAETIRAIMVKLSQETANYRYELAAVGRDPFSKELISINQARSQRQTQAKENEREDVKRARETSGLEEAKQKVKEARQAWKDSNFTYSLGVSYDEYARMKPQQREAMLSNTGLADKMGLQDSRKEIETLAEAIAAAERQVNSARERLANATEKGRPGSIPSKYAEAEAAAAKLDAAKRQDVLKRMAEEEARIIEQNQQQAMDTWAQAQAEKLRREGKELEAERLLILTEANKTGRAIMRAAQDQANALGAGMFDPRRWKIFGLALTQAAGVQERARQQTAGAELSDYERQRASQRDLALLQAEGQPTDYAREKAALDARYEYEMDVAEKAGRKTWEIRQRWMQETSNLETKYEARRLDAHSNMVEEIARAEIETTKQGLEARLALIERDRQKALRENEGKDTGVSSEAINRLFDLRALAARQQADRVSASGTFSARAAQAMAGSNNPADRTAKATEQTVRKLEEVKESVDDVKGAVENIAFQ